MAALFISSASAQSGKNYDIKTMNFDLWCQEPAHLPDARCDKRTPEDEKTFQAFRDQVERYEVPYLQQRRMTSLQPGHHAQRSGGQSGDQNPGPRPNPNRRPKRRALSGYSLNRRP